MTKYWANAIALNALDKPTRLFTYNAVNSIAECDEIFMKWATKYPYKLLITWVDAVYDCGSKKMIHKKEYI